MKHELIDDYKKPILLTCLDLENNDFGQNWIMSILSHPIAEGVAISNSDGSWGSSNLYINFGEVEVDIVKGRNAYIDLHVKIKQYISEKNDLAPRINHFYNSHPLVSVDKSKKKHIFLFLSTKESDKIFDYELIKDKDVLVKNVLELLLKVSFVNRTQKSRAVGTDVCYGKVFLNPIAEPRKNGTMFADVFSYNLIYKNSKLDFKLKNEVFALSADNGEIKKFDDVCYINNYKYGKKVDARKNKRLFLDFKNFKNLKRTRFYTQFELYKIILETLDAFNIKYEKSRFTPEYLYNYFGSVEVDIKPINVYACKQEINMFNAEMSKHGLDSGMDSLCKYMESKHGLAVKVIFDPSFKDVLDNKSTPGLFLMYGDKYDDNFVSKTVNGVESKWSNSLDAFLDNKLNPLNEADLMKELVLYDSYSRVKLFNIYANMNGLEPIVSQGLILDDEMDFQTLEEKDSIKSGSKGDINQSENKKLKSTAAKFILEKVINELNIKNTLFNKRHVYLNSFKSYIDNVEFKNIKIIQYKKVGSHRLYSTVDLECSDVWSSSLQKFNVTKYEILLDEDVNRINVDFNVREEFKNSTSLILINNSFLIKVRDNDFAPCLLLEEANIGNKDLDVSLLMDKHCLEQNDASTYVSRASGIKENLFFPYNQPVINKMIGGNQKQSHSRVNCLMDYSGDGVRLFINLSETALNNTIPKNNRIEELHLFKLDEDEFEYKKANWLEYDKILFFYLSTLTFNYININELTKTSILNKLGDLVLLN